MQKKLLILLTVVLLVLLSDRFIFTPYKYRVEMNPQYLSTDLNSKLELEIYKTNILGLKVPFSKPHVKFTTENENLIEIIQTESNKALVISKGISGEAIVVIYSTENIIELKRIIIPILFPPSASF